MVQASVSLKVGPVLTAAVDSSISVAGSGPVGRLGGLIPPGGNASLASKAKKPTVKFAASAPAQSESTPFSKVHQQRQAATPSTESTKPKSPDYVLCEGSCEMKPTQGTQTFEATFAMKIDSASNHALLIITTPGKEERVHNVMDLQAPTMHNGFCRIESYAGKSNASYTLKLKDSTWTGKFKFYLESLRTAAIRQQACTGDEAKPTAAQMRAASCLSKAADVALIGPATISPTTPGATNSDQPVEGKPSKFDNVDAADPLSTMEEAVEPALNSNLLARVQSSNFVVLDTANPFGKMEEAVEPASNKNRPAEAQASNLVDVDTAIPFGAMEEAVEPAPNGNNPAELQTPNLVDIDTGNSINTVEEAAEQLHALVHNVMAELKGRGLRLSEEAIDDVEETALDVWFNRNLFDSHADDIKSDMLGLLKGFSQLKRQADRMKKKIQTRRANIGLAESPSLQSLKDLKIGAGPRSRIQYTTAEIEELSDKAISRPVDLDWAEFLPMVGEKRSGRNAKSATAEVQLQPISNMGTLIDINFNPTMPATSSNGPEILFKDSISSKSAVNSQPTAVATTPLPSDTEKKMACSGPAKDETKDTMTTRQWGQQKRPPCERMAAYHHGGQGAALSSKSHPIAAANVQSNTASSKPRTSEPILTGLLSSLWAN
ncbi:hypothetical protein DCS_01649 [Drechmeria coniospora]|uniref:Uncharacterized protein n=1 Tax=Drechmeria coniospora TaxID=98403 RepID=A0A151GU25_DRECN|nr:hypothetical protein DCS_01649 [Drechmeria coniospora]KYK60512.1 hypothetical protein DCS_01649 [Drechmeria coniospora]